MDSSTANNQPAKLPTIGILSEAFIGKETLSQISREIHKYIIPQVQTVGIISLGRDIDKVIAGQLSILKKEVNCYVVNKSSKEHWSIHPHVSRFFAEKVPYGKKIEFALQESLVRDSSAILAFWSGNTISNSVHCGLQLAEKLNKHIIQRIVL